MKRIRAAALWMKEKYDLLAEKKYTTVAGMLVFFLIMSVIPFAFWLTLLFGRLSAGAEKVLALPVFGSVKEILLFIQNEAQNATVGASVFLIATTFYSATNFFYHMRRSGEIIYAYKRPKKGFLIRLAAAGSMLAVMLLLAASVFLFGIIAFLFSKWLPRGLELSLDYMFLLVIAFVLVLGLNVYICPYKVKVKSLLSGTAATVAAWAVAVIGFAVYLKFGNMSRLYGALSTVVVFLLWLYMLMVCFVAGVIFNSRKIVKKKSKRF